METIIIGLVEVVELRMKVVMLQVPVVQVVCIMALVLVLVD